VANGALPERGAAAPAADDEPDTVTVTQINTATIPCVDLRVAPADLPLVEELVSALELTCASWTNVESPAAVVWIFADSAAAAAECCGRISDALQTWAGQFRGPLPAPRVVQLPREDWAHSWQQRFPVVRVSRRLVLKPSWERVTAGPGDVVLELDPGMCFGTGYHGTTRACLEFMDDLAARLGPASFLDVGCGSGILSLAAVKLGFSPVLAFDHDPQAVGTARDNLAKAGLRVRGPIVADLADYAPPQRVRVIAANVLAPVLVEHRRRLCAWLDRAAGPAYLILSGIETAQYPQVRDAFADVGAAERACRSLDEWTSGCFEVVTA
jgi:ribosomal protein L11 methyltransferase